MDKLLYQYTLTIVSLILFLYGYFPVQQNQSQDAIAPPTYLNDIKINVDDVYKAQADRIVVVVIDALRMDFVTNKNLPFITSTFHKDGCMLDVHVHSPTVTLPRIKALTTGRVPQFFDVVLNLASTEVLNDSVLHRAKQAGKRIIFYGDDTWVNLYPNMFERYEGVSSFFVNDYTEVDNNVTRNVEKELNNNDWDLMLLHYLGLDHIGHVYGPFSHLVENKLLEMDNIVKTIYQKTQSHEKKTLIFVTGDHGMKDSGGHGGTTLEETSVPLLILGNNCKNDSIVQTDISATLAALMGLTLPSGNTGRINLNIFGTLTHDRTLYILNYGACSLKSQTMDYENVFEKASSVYYKFLQTRDEVYAENAKILYQRKNTKFVELSSALPELLLLMLKASWMKILDLSLFCMEQ
ncbi:hypothetical protein RN001_001233 [Aquatica leii]|uniref:GPI ethanolamine phosphate transferase 2 n=1 Tax=Aquatica leii TaxID=1421715 RepID=A0AAN7Q7R0_9COLE|nr:hypothetical protein RN001_001233 [Aquatica leii]